MSTMYQRDYIIVTNLCNGFLYLPEISMSHIEGAKERYKEINKSALEASPLSYEIKILLSAQKFLADSNKYLLDMSSFPHNHPDH